MDTTYTEKHPDDAQSFEALRRSQGSLVTGGAVGAPCGTMPDYARAAVQAFYSNHPLSNDFREGAPAWAGSGPLTIRTTSTDPNGRWGYSVKQGNQTDTGYVQNDGMVYGDNYFKAAGAIR
jgi:hypothetical protein